MVLLTMTAAIVEALRKVQSRPGLEEESPQSTTGQALLEREKGRQEKEGEDKNTLGVGDATTAKGGMESLGKPHTFPSPKLLAESVEEALGTGKAAGPPLSISEVGKPITHEQIIDLSKDMKRRGLEPYQLEALLKGARVFVPPPPPKAEPTSEYKTLMARLRREEEARSYERMTNPPPSMETFAQRFPYSSAAHAFSSNQQSMKSKETEDDGITYADVNRQMALILNVLLSIVACSAAIWIAAKWWSTPARLALSMSGSLLVGIAEVVVYSGYIQRISQAKGEAARLKEVKEVVNTWVVGAGEEIRETINDETMIPIKPKEDKGTARVRLATKHKAQ